MTADVQVFIDALLAEGFPDASIQKPGQEGYEANRKEHFNRDVVCHPLLMLRPSTTQEVSAAVRGYGKGLSKWKQENRHNENDVSFPYLCICGGGHSVRSMKEGAVVLDLALMQKVQVDAQAQTVTVEGGVKIEKMLDTLTPHHLAPVTGSKYYIQSALFLRRAVSLLGCCMQDTKGFLLRHYMHTAHTDTGVIGLTLGGGQGFLSKQYGPAVDQIVSAEVVLADGSIRRIEAGTILTTVISCSI